jgi:hypothetical protein
MDVDPIFVQMSTDTAIFLVITFKLKFRHWNRTLHRASIKQVSLLVFSIRVFYEFWSLCNTYMVTLARKHIHTLVKTEYGNEKMQKTSPHSKSKRFSEKCL